MDAFLKTLTGVLAALLSAVITIGTFVLLVWLTVWIVKAVWQG